MEDVTSLIERADVLLGAAVVALGAALAAVKKVRRKVAAAAKALKETE